MKRKNPGGRDCRSTTFNWAFVLRRSILFYRPNLWYLSNAVGLSSCVRRSHPLLSPSVSAFRPNSLFSSHISFLHCRSVLGDLHFEFYGWSPESRLSGNGSNLSNSSKTAVITSGPRDHLSKAVSWSERTARGNWGAHWFSVLICCHCFLKGHGAPLGKVHQPWNFPFEPSRYLSSGPLINVRGLLQYTMIFYNLERMPVDVISIWFIFFRVIVCVAVVNFIPPELLLSTYRFKDAVRVL